MITRRPPCFAGMSAYFVDENDAPLFNEQGNLATDQDVDRVLARTDCSGEVDRLIREVCAYHRARSEPLKQCELDLELKAFQRMRRSST